MVKNLNFKAVSKQKKKPTQNRLPYSVSVKYLWLFGCWLDRIIDLKMSYLPLRHFERINLNNFNNTLMLHCGAQHRHQMKTERERLEQTETRYNNEKVLIKA